MSDFPQFLAARLDEQVNYVGVQRITDRTDQPLGDFLLADIAAKRAILDRHKELVNLEDHYRDTVPSYSHTFSEALKEVELVIVHLCRPFAEHPDYPGEKVD
jgi:hypothetical protein